MGKFSLNFDDLKVDSFETTPEDEDEEGTVQANGTLDCTTNVDGCTRELCSVGCNSGNTCDDTCDCDSGPDTVCGICYPE